MTVADVFFEIAAKRLVEKLGVDLHRGGLERSVRRYVQARARALGDAAKFAARLDDAAGEELTTLIEAATVSHSWLFRDPQQLDALRAILATWPRGPLRVWVPGCANGEDAFTLAAIALELGHDVRVLATDVRESALSRARSARFTAWAARALPPSASRWFERDEGGLRATDALHARVEVRRHSLVDAPMLPDDGAGWDVVVCRNVLIYLTRAQADAAITSIARAVREGGLVVFGVTDVMLDLPDGLSAAHASRLVLVRAPEPAKTKKPVPVAPPLEPVRSPIAPATAPDVPRAPDALELLSAGRTDEALALARETLASRPTEAHAHFVVGLAHYVSGAFEDAIERLRSAACLEAQAWPALVYLGFAHERRGEWSAARRAFLRAARAGHDAMSADWVRGESQLARTIVGQRADLLNLAARRAALLEGADDDP